MDNNVSNKLFELVDSIKQNEKILRMKQLKSLIEKDEVLKKDLDRFHKIVDNPYDTEYVELKRKILDNSLVKEYKNLENELYFIVLDLNNKLNKLIDKRKCSSWKL